MSLYLKNKKIWVIGGSKGIGLALAKRLAQKGAKVIVSARTRPQGDFPHEFIPLDVTDRKKLLAVIKKMTDCDGLIYSSGILSPSYVSDMDEKHLQDLMTINVVPAVLLVAKLGRHLEKKRGFFVFMGSVSGVVGLPFGQPYSGGKYFLKNFAETTAVEFPNMQTHLVAPGYVKTDMISGNRFVMPLIYSAERAAKIIVNGIVFRRSVINFPLLLHGVVSMINISPFWLRRWVWQVSKNWIVKKK